MKVNKMWQTVDGNCFPLEKKKEAQIYENGVLLMNNLMEQAGFKMDTPLKHICLEISKNFPKYQLLMKQISRTNNL